MSSGATQSEERRIAGELTLGEVEFCVIDLETTGFTRVDRVIEVAIQRVDLDGNVIAEYETLLNPDRTTAGNTEIHGITDRDLAEAPRFRDIIGDLAEILDESVWVAHNSSFDARFMANEFARVELTMPEWPTLCTMRLTSAMGGPGQPTLTACCEYHGVALDGEAHRAMVDVRATTAVLLRMLGPSREASFNEIYGTDTPPWSAALPRLGVQVPPSRTVHLRGDRKVELSLSSDLATGAGANHPGLELYRTKLRAAMEDRLIEDVEFRDLLGIVASEQISPSQAHELHASYFQECASKALADGRIDSSEERDLARVAQVLTIDPSLVPELIATAPPPVQVVSEAMIGRTVCFTGAVDATRKGTQITREDLTEAAIAVGMVPKSGVSKKLDILVAADPHSLSGKARKARDLGIRIVTAGAFLTMIGYATD